MICDNTMWSAISPNNLLFDDIHKPLSIDLFVTMDVPSHLSVAIHDNEYHIIGGYPIRYLLVSQ